MGTYTTRNGTLNLRPIGGATGPAGPEGPEGPEGPQGQDALGTEPQQQVVADWMAGTGGANPVSTTLSGVIDARVPAASATAQGKVELATSAETTTGTDTVRAVTPAGVKATLDIIRRASIADRHMTRALATIPTPRVATSAPTVTYSADPVENDTQRADRGVIRVGRGLANLPAVARFIGTAYEVPTYFTVQSDSNNGSPTVYGLESWYDGSSLEWLYRCAVASPRTLMIYVDDEPISATLMASTDNGGPSQGAGSNGRVTLTFPDARRRKIRIESSLLQHSSFNRESGATLTPTVAPKAGSLVVFGDSWVGGSYVAIHDTFTQRMARRLGMDAHNCGQGGTGPTTAGSTGGQAWTTAARITKAAAVGCAFPIIFGTVNHGGSTVSAITDAMASVLSQWATAAPSQKIIIFGPPTLPGTAMVQGIYNARDGEKAAALAAPNVLAFVDLIDGIVTRGPASTTAVGGGAPGTTFGDGVPWIVGTGKNNGRTGDGNSDVVIGNDAVHPTRVGNDYLAGRMADLWLDLTGNRGATSEG